MTELSPARPTDPATILATLIECLGEVLGSDVVSLMTITEQTKAMQELGLSSLDMLRLVEAIEQYYPVAEPLVIWIAGKPVLELAQVTVGDIVEFIGDVLR
ncbi:MAG: phosphopantetheine-binding protein [Propionibacteriaceae bacterium]|jgi:acyl carrier protein|nr:phosphopantetheine-binding protein [Propionibacteriaceae bacterium]